jgi:acetyl esterase
MNKMKTAVNPAITTLLNTIADKMKELNHPPLDILTPEQSRIYYKIARGYFTPINVDKVWVNDTYITSSEGHEIPLRIYTPEGEGPFPVLIYFHGGGWVFGDLDSSDNVCRYFARHSSSVIVSAGYRHAPEHKYPAAFHDAIESVKWTFENVQKLNGDSNRIAVGGESSGGNLASAASIYFREDEHFGLSAQFLITPVMDYRFDTLSYRENHQYNLTIEKMKWFWNHYLSDAAQGAEVFVSPLRTPSVLGLPKTLLVTAEFDPLREEGLTYGQRLQEVGVPVNLLHYEDLVHSFINMIGTVEAAREALQEMTAALREILHT